MANKFGNTRRKGQRANRSSVRTRRRNANERRHKVAVMLGLGYPRERIARELNVHLNTLDADIRYIKDHVDPLTYGPADAVLADLAQQLVEDGDKALLLKVLQERHKLAGIYRQDLDRGNELATAMRLMQEAMRARQSD